MPNKIILLIVWIAMAVETGLLLTQHYGRADQLATYLFIAIFVIGIWRLAR